MNIRFIILKAGDSRPTDATHFDNYEIAWGSTKDKVDCKWRAQEFTSYEEASAALKRARSLHKKCSYRLACVWDET